MTGPGAPGGAPGDERYPGRAPGAQGRAPGGVDDLRAGELAMASAERMRLVPSGGGDRPDAVRLTWRRGTEHATTEPLVLDELPEAAHATLAKVGLDPHGTERLRRRGLSLSREDLQVLVNGPDALAGPVGIFLLDVGRREHAARAAEEEVAAHEAAARQSNAPAPEGADRRRAGPGRRSARLGPLDRLPGLTGLVAVGLLVGMMFTGPGTTATAVLAGCLGLAVVVTAVLAWLGMRSRWRALAAAQLRTPNRAVVEAASAAASRYRIGGRLQVGIYGAVGAFLLFALTQDRSGWWVLLPSAVLLVVGAVVIGLAVRRDGQIHDRERGEVERRGVRGAPGGVQLEVRERIEPDLRHLP
ncbi:hypothetical protein [Georgenia sp. Z1491]|uniref:hypothetical protein n=1 Tax=Georgenia sp. Z1491 TaxID=3416707 RepID=UPI003CF3816F